MKIFSKISKSKFSSIFLVVFISILLTTIFTWPYASKLGSFFYDRGDYPISGSILSYTEQSIRSGKIFTPEYFNGNQFYPQPYSLIYFDFRFIPSLIYTPIFWITHNFILSVNLVLFLTFVFCFIASFYTIRYFAKNFLASVIGAVVYTFNPITFSRFPEHFDLFNKYFLPLVFLFGYKFFSAPSFKNSLYFFLVFTLNAFSAIYFQTATMLLLPIFALPFLLKKIGQNDKKYFLKLLTCSLVSLIFIPFILYFDLKYLEFSNKENFTRSLQDANELSARLIDYIGPVKNSFLYGSFYDFLEPHRGVKDEIGNFNALEHTLFLNIIPMFLFVFFLINYRKKRHRNILTTSLLIILGTSFILTFGPYFYGWNSEKGSLPLPYYFFYKLIPFLKSSRAPARMEFLFYVPFSIFVAFGAWYLFDRLKKVKLIVSVFLLILLGLILENLNLTGAVVSYNEKSIVIPSLLKMDPDGKELSFLRNKNTLHIPLFFPESGMESYFINWTSITGEKLVNGNPASYIPIDQFIFLINLKKGLNENSLKQLKAINVDYIIFHEELKKNNEPILNQYDQSVVYNKNQIKIYDLNKIPLQVKLCDFSKDLTLTPATGRIGSPGQIFYALIIKNNSDCYLPGVYQNRYQKIQFSKANLFGESTQSVMDIKLPPIINPFQEVTLTEINKEIKVQ